MPSPVDLEQRFRSAAVEPDTERALVDVMGRIRRRTRRKVVAVVTAVAVAAGLVAVWGVERERSHKSSVFIGRTPDTTASAASNGEVRLRPLWSAHDIGMSDSLAASNGRIVVTTDDAVFAAEGFGAEAVGHVTALDRARGTVRWTAALRGPVFLQGVGGGTVIAAATVPGRIVGLDAENGKIRWRISLSDLGLDGYRAVTSAIASPISAVGLSAESEGDVRPPVVLGVNIRAGEVVWRTNLVRGTDLNWGTPPVRGGETVFLSTLSHPESAKENVAHLIDLADGSVRWAVGMGGGQGFHSNPAVINGPYVHLPAYPEVLTVDRANGRRRWSRADAGAVFAADDALWTWTTTGPLVSLDPGDGRVTRRVDSPIDEPAQLLDLGNGLVGVVGRTEFAAITEDGAVRLRRAFAAPLVDVALFDRGTLVVATSDRAVTAYALVISRPG